MSRGRPAKAIPSVEKTISIPSDVVARIDLELHSALLGKVPHGAWASLVTELLRQHLNKLQPQGSE